MPSQLKICGKSIGAGSPTFIIAEAGVNHCGKVEQALEMVDVAKASGSDAVKFQIFDVDALLLKDLEKAPYQKGRTPEEDNQYDMLKKLQLGLSDFRKIRSYCDKVGIGFLATPFDEGSLEDLVSLEVDAIKVASTDTTNLPFLERIADTGKGVILSTAMCSLTEVDLAVRSVLERNQRLVLLQCTANYPLDPREVNLRVIGSYQNLHGCNSH